MKNLLPAFVACLTFGAPAALAQDYPTRPIRIVIPLTPGSGADIAGRIVAKHMSDAWKQPVIVENRPGAGGQIGTQAVVSAEPDGYTLLVQSASHAANPAIYKSLPYDPLKDLVDVAILGVTPYVMVTAKGGAYPNLKALVDDAKARPGAVPFASAGVGSSTHLAAEYFAQAAGVKMLHVPYKGSPEAIQDTIAGRTSFYMAPINTALGQVKEGRLGALGVSTRKRADVAARRAFARGAGPRRVRHLALVRDVGARWHAARGGAEAQRAGERDRRRRGGARAVREARHHAGADEARRVREVRARPDRDLPGDRQGRGRPAAVAADSGRVVSRRYRAMRRAGPRRSGVAPSKPSPDPKPTIRGVAIEERSGSDPTPCVGLRQSEAGG